ncbi:MAG: hypothetical protein SFW36_08635 [Leptolyngbyaceae cyanobacterium bins.59]|nr:hypothetical protein [Leptolyngbyaceae cyanobacterium bins.59]
MLDRQQATMERLESLARSLAAGQERQERLLDYLMQRDRDRS